MPPKLPNKKTRSEFYKATLEQTPPPRKYLSCKLEGGTHETMQQHLACRRRELRLLGAVMKSQTPDLKFPDENPDLKQVKEALRGQQQLMLEDIKQKGYTIQQFYNVDEATVKYLHDIANNRRSEGIDNEGEARKETKKPDQQQCRRAVPLTPDIQHLVGLFMVLTALVEACGDGIFNAFRLLSGGWNLLYNVPPCLQQIKHKDYDAVIKGSHEDSAAKAAGSRLVGPNYTGRDKALSLAEMPLSVLYSVEDDTWWMAGDERIHLRAGHFVIFRGDFEHAGAAYDNFTVRLHAYFDHACLSTPLRFSTKKPFEKAIFYTQSE